MKPRHKRFAFIGLGLLVLGCGDRADLKRLPEQSRVLFYTHASRRRRSPARA